MYVFSSERGCARSISTLAMSWGVRRYSSCIVSLLPERVQTHNKGRRISQANWSSARVAYAFQIILWRDYVIQRCVLEWIVRSCFVGTPGLLPLAVVAPPPPGSAAGWEIGMCSQIRPRELISHPAALPNPMWPTDPPSGVVLHWPHSFKIV